MRRARDIDVEAARRDLIYNPDTGLITRKNGAICGSSNPYDYIRVPFMDASWLAHRIAWAMHHGSIDPFMVIDHINFDKHDNRISNLQQITWVENLQRGNYRKNPELAKRLQAYAQRNMGHRWRSAIVDNSIKRVAE